MIQRSDSDCLGATPSASNGRIWYIEPQLIKHFGSAPFDLPRVPQTHSQSRFASEKYILNNKLAFRRGISQSCHCESRMTLQKFMRWKFGSLSASTSAFTLPNVVSGLCMMPS